MKHYHHLWILPLLAVFGCTKEVSVPTDAAGEFTLTVSTAQTKTALGPADGSVRSTLWQEGDCISTGGVASLPLSAAQAGTKTATFTFKGALGAPFNVISPASEFEDRTVFPSVQKYVAGSYDPAAVPMIGGSMDFGDVNLRHCVSVMELNLTGDIAVRSITAMCTSGELLSGTMVFGKDSQGVFDGTATIRDGLISTTLDCGENGIQLSSAPQTFHIAVPAGEYKDDLTIIVKSTEDPQMQLTYHPDGGRISPATLLHFATTEFEDLSSVILITSPEELKAFATEHSQSKYMLMADIDLGGFEWPTVDSFSGTFDGQGHSITNFTVNNALTRTGFIGTLESGAKIKNITFGSATDGSSITLCHSDESNWCYAGLFAYVCEGATIQGVKNYVNVSASSASTSKHSVGGIAGNLKKNVTVNNCENYGAVTDNSSFGSGSDCCIGGIAGMSDSEGTLVSNCSNHGNVTNHCTATTDLGGILGRISGANSVKDCSNDAVIDNNAASISSSSNWRIHVGGIVGHIGAANASVVKCSNSGAVKQTKALASHRLCMGGIVGGSHKTGVDILGCTNTGLVRTEGEKNTTDCAVGGILGYADYQTRISKAEDGTPTTSTSNWVQTIAIGSTFYYGGIAGCMDTTNGLVEYATANGYLESNDLGSDGKNFYAGGIIGSTKGTVLYCENNIYTYFRYKNNGALNIRYGGICGGTNSRAPKEVAFCTNNGAIGGASCKNNSAFGGILATLVPNTTNVHDCVNNGIIAAGKASGNDITDITNIQTLSNVYFGGLFGTCEKTTEPAVVAKNCTINCALAKQTPTSFTYCGFIQGKVPDTIPYKLCFGSDDEPIKISSSCSVYVGSQIDGSSKIATMTDKTTANKYLQGSSNTHYSESAGTSDTSLLEFKYVIVD